MTKELETLIVQTKTRSRNKSLSMMKAGDEFTVEFDFKMGSSPGNLVEMLRCAMCKVNVEDMGEKTSQVQS